MRGKKAKRIRKEMYETEDFRDRSYYKVPNGSLPHQFQIIADGLRQEYQKRKKDD